MQRYTVVNIIQVQCIHLNYGFVTLTVNINAVTTTLYMYRTILQLISFCKIDVSD